MGQALLNQGQVDASIKELNTALYQFPNSWPVRLALGKAYETQGNTVAAVREYQESIRIKPENRIGFAQTLLAQNRFQEAAEQMNTVIAHAPNAKQTFAVADLALMIHDSIAPNGLTRKRQLSQAPPNAPAAG
jgi:tetratricopeptide (TPR) repeat protein